MAKTLLLSFDATSNWLKDWSADNRTVDAIGAAQASTARSRYGIRSAYMPDTDSYLRLPAAAFAPGAGAFCVQFWVFRDATSWPGYWQLFGDWGAANRFQLSVYSGQLAIERAGLGTTASGIAMPLKTWCHIALTCDGTTVRIFQDGVKLIELANSNPALWASGTGYWGLGRMHGQSGYGAALGYIDDLAITLDDAVYTTDFTPPGPLVAKRLQGNVTTTAGVAADRVLWHDWVTGELASAGEPDAAGDWAIDVPVGQYSVTYLADGCQPVTHGPYTVALE